MGNKLSQITFKRFRVSVTTGDKKGAGTDANVYLALYDEKGNKSQPLKLDKAFYNDLERGRTDKFSGPKVDDDFGEVTELELWRDNTGVFAPWYCDVIVVTDTKNNQSQAFPIQRWVKKNHHYRIPAEHTTLPQDDKYPTLRAEELADKRAQYQYAQIIPGLPIQVKKLPEDEQFSDEYKWDIISTKYEMVIKSKLTQYQVKAQWQSMDDISQLYTYDVFTKPKPLKYYKDDLWFAAQRLAGCNPTKITLCTEIPNNFQVTDEMVSGFLEGRSLTQAVQDKKLFLIDHKIVQGLPVVNKDSELSCPLALFYLDNSNQLRPIAIQLKQDPGPNNPVFLPSDPENLWMLAKMWFNLADAMVHQSLTHLGFTHLFMEGVVVNTHRNLALNHPVFRLLAPHFLFLLAINTRGLALLISPDGWVQKTMQIGVSGMAELINRGLAEYRLDVTGTLPEDLKARGVDNPDVLPVYPYRDDALPVYNAIHSYVSDIINIYYDSPEKLQNDQELKAWGKDLVTPRPNGIEMKGVPNNGDFQTVDDVIKVITSIIFTCSVQHAINFLQYDEYGFPPNYPALLQAKLPTDKSHVPTDQELVDMLPDKETTLDTMIVTKLLSMQANNNLGDWEFRYQHDEAALEAEKKFREKLERISKDVAEKNDKRSEMLKYEVLDPAQIPNSISI